VEGQAAVVLTGVHPQPATAGRSDEEIRAVAEVLAGQLALSLRRVVLHRELERLARTDPLTACTRRWYGEARLQEICELGEVVAVAMVDIDHFKLVNDRLGHAAGDHVLAAVGGALAGHVRTGDLVVRWGGEEFLVILPGTSPAGAHLVAERLRNAVSAISGLPLATTVSLGVAACAQDEAMEDLVQRADQALYEAKRVGRDCTVLAEAPTDARLRTTARRIRHSQTSGEFRRSGERRASGSGERRVGTEIHVSSGLHRQARETPSGLHVKRDGSSGTHPRHIQPDQQPPQAPSAGEGQPPP
jgi:diguanylate cyclase (GGDEF)-like protein